MPSVDPQIFAKSFVRRPEANSHQIVELAKELSPGNSPILVPVEPMPKVKPDDCFYNVSAHVEANGGEMLYGWAIWIFPRVFIEAEHHAVWKSGDKLIDITPKKDDETQIVFIPDPEREYDFEENQRLDNVRRALSSSRATADLLRAYSDRSEFLERNSVGLEVRVDPQAYQNIQMRVMHCFQRVILEIALKIGRNDECLCISGKKFKRCCGPLFRIYD